MTDHVLALDIASLEAQANDVIIGDEGLARAIRRRRRLEALLDLRDARARIATLERERDEARADAASWRQQNEMQVDNVLRLGAERDAALSRVEELRAALDSLLDGLDSNADERCGLTQGEWDQRVRAVRALLARTDAGGGV